MPDYENAFVGEVRFWGRCNFGMPEGWFLCDGSSYRINQYPALYAVIGHRYGRGVSSNTFNVPDLRALGVMGTGQRPDSAFNFPLGQPVGEESVVQTQANLPTHTHVISPVSPPAVSLGASTAPATQANPTDNAYLAAGELQVGLSTTPLRQYVSVPQPDTTAPLAGLNATGTGALTATGENQPTPRENRQPQLWFGFFIAWDGIFPTRS